MNQQFALLVFDWDGTLMNSEARIVHAMQQAMSASGLEVLSKNTIRSIIGLGINEAVGHLYGNIGQSKTSRLAQAYREAFLDSREIELRLFPGVEETLDILEARGYLLAIATGKGRTGLNRELDETGLRTRFHATRCADESFSKPHPEMLKEVMRRCGVSPEVTLMIGDTTFDLEMANNAGVASVGVNYGMHSESSLRQLDPLTILNHIGDLPPWLVPDCDDDEALTDKRNESLG